MDDLDSTLGESRIKQTEGIIESPQQYSCSQDLLESYRLPQTILLVQKVRHFANGGEGISRKEALARGLIYRFLT